MLPDDQFEDEHRKQKHAFQIEQIQSGKKLRHNENQELASGILKLFLNPGTYAKCLLLRCRDEFGTRTLVQNVYVCDAQLTLESE